MSHTASPSIKLLETTCCIAGGGPAGMMLGYLLARAGIDVVVLEKHADFLRDFRGDTIHPSTLELMRELGLLDELLKRPHQKVYKMTGIFGGEEFTFADFSRLPVKNPFVAFMPQWDFLDFLADEAKKFPSFHLRMQAQVTDLVEENGVVKGVMASTPEGWLEIHAPLTVGADGRHSTVRKKAGLPVQNIGAPIDVLWMRLSRKPTDPDQPSGRFDRGRIFVMLYRGDYWQCAYVIPKGGFDGIRERGLESFRSSIAEIVPFMADRVQELKSWDDVKLLSVAVDRLESWAKPGLLCLGDAAHAMSPVGGVGINLAIQDTVAAANILTRPLRENRLRLKDLEKVQRRRQLPTRLTQGLQVALQERVLGRVIATKQRLSPPWFLRVMLGLPFLRTLPARIMGLGFRRERVAFR